MYPMLVRLISVPIVAVLLIFNLRRIFFTLTILFLGHNGSERRQARTDPNPWPDILVLVPCRDEENMIAGLCQAIDCLDYPRDRHQVVLINDGSRDGSGALMEHCARGRSNWNVLSLPVNVGKANALNAALSQFPFGEIVYVFDADHCPKPDVLKRAAQYFDDERVAGVSGRTLPSNPLASPIAYYSTVENFIHQLVTMRAKDRLHLAPALLGGNCGYRRNTLVQCGAFRAGALLEDADLTFTFYEAGYLVRFAQDTVAYHQMPETVGGYLEQHRRWARGFNEVAKHHVGSLLRDNRLSPLLRFELLLFASGYLDRLALMSAGVLTTLSFLSPSLFPFPREILYFALLTPMVQIIALFAEQRLSRAMWLRLPLIPIFLALDIFAAGRAMVDSLLNRTTVWTKTARAQRQSVYDLMNKD
jgi:1,2-diacylglycerol 3-beta-glucosyltransferase